jgi:large subunit GTPase 1
MYLKEQGISYMFWSAKVATAILEGKVSPDAIASNVDEEEADDEDAVVLEREELLGRVQKMAEDIAETRRRAAQASLSKHLETHGSSLSQGKSETDPGVGTSNASGRVMVGFVGYPNVGKSSTINALVGEKKTGVTSTPGKTKHFQTLIISEKLTLCDCPGLVFPSFTTSRSEMVAAGVLPVDRMTDHRGPIQVVANKVPRAVLESTYGFTLPAPKPYENPNRPPTAAELLRAYAMSRGHVASSGLPDETRASRTILKDYLSGKLLFCYAPPNEEQAGFSQRIGTSSQVGDEDDEDEDEFDLEEGSDDEDDEDDESQSEGEDGEPSGSGSMGGKLLGVGDSNLEDVFGDLDTLTIGADVRGPKTKNLKEKAPHKMHRKVARKKDRSWRVTNDGSDGMPSSSVVQKPVSHGAAKVRLSV